MFKKIALLLAFAVASTLSYGQNELVLSAVSSNSQPAPWSFTTVTFTLQNESFATYSNVTVDFNINNNLRLKGGDEFTASTGTLQDFWTNFPTWNIGNIGPSEEATITLNLFVLGSSAPSHVYGQVETAIGDPLFSTPGNGTCCTSNERDEAVFNLNGSNPLGGGKSDVVINYWGNSPSPNQGGEAFADFRFKNIGTADVGSFFYSIFLSSDNTLSSDDEFIRGQRYDLGIPAGQTRNVAITFPLPANLFGQQYIIISIDPANEIDELNENNQLFFRTMFINPVNNGIDLLPNVIDVTDATLTPDGTQWQATATYRILNNGNQNAPSSSHAFYISRDNEITADDIYLGPLFTSTLDAGASQSFTRDFVFPSSMSGVFRLIIASDVGNAIVESNEQNNVISKVFRTGFPPSGQVDLELNFEIPTDNYDFPQWSFFPAVVTIINKGTQAATGVKAEFRQTELTTFKGGDEANVTQGNFNWVTRIWDVGTIQPGETAAITVNLFRLSPQSFIMYSQITAMNEPDVDSTPGDGICCSGASDDESIWLVAASKANGVNNRSMIVENLGNQPFAIVNATPNPIVDRFNLQVYSNEAQTSELTVVNTLGQPVFRQEVELVKGHNTIPVRLENTAAGLHSVRMTPFHPYLRQFKVMKIQD